LGKDLTVNYIETQTITYDGLGFKVRVWNGVTDFITEMEL
jgi:hypothetical protein